MLFSNIIEAVQAILEKSDYTLRVNYLDEEANEVTEAIRVCREHKPMGILFLGSNAQYFKEQFAQVNVPCVLVTDRGDELEFDNLFRKSGISEAEGAEMIAAMPEYYINYMMWLKPGTIDIYNIESVTVAGEDIAFSSDETSGIYGEDSEEIKKMLDNYEKLRDIESSPLYTPADEWFDCDGKRVHVTGYAFDTVNLRIRYETCYDEPIKKTSSAAYFYQITNVFPDNSAGCSSADISYDRAEEGIVETLQNIYATEPVDSLEVPFGDSFFSVSYNSNIPKIEREINKEVSFKLKSYQNSAGKMILPIFTDKEDIERLKLNTTAGSLFMRDLYKSIVPIQDSFDQIIINPSAENEYKISIDEFLSLFDEEREFEDLMKEIEEEMLEDENMD